MAPNHDDGRYSTLLQSIGSKSVRPANLCEVIDGSSSLNQICSNPESFTLSHKSGACCLPTAQIIEDLAQYSTSLLPITESPESPLTNSSSPFETTFESSMESASNSHPTTHHTINEIRSNNFPRPLGSLSRLLTKSTFCWPLSNSVSALNSPLTVTTSSKATHNSLTIAELSRTTTTTPVKAKSGQAGSIVDQRDCPLLVYCLLSLWLTFWSSSVRHCRTTCPTGQSAWVLVFTLFTVCCCLVPEVSSVPGDNSSSSALSSTLVSDVSSTGFRLSPSASSSVPRPLLTRPIQWPMSAPMSAGIVRRLVRRHAVRPINFNSNELKLLDHLINHQQVNSVFHHKPQRARLASHGLFESKSSEEIDVDPSNKQGRLSVAAANQRRNIQSPMERMMSLHGKTSASPESITNNVRQSMTNRMVSKAPRTYLTESKHRYEQRDESNESGENLDPVGKLPFNIAQLSLSDGHALVKSVIQNGLIEQLDTKTLEYLAFKYGYRPEDQVNRGSSNGLDNSGRMVEVQLDEENPGEDYESGTVDDPEHEGSKLESMVGVDIQPMAMQEALNPEEELLTSPFGSKAEPEQSPEEKMHDKSTNNNENSLESSSGRASAKMSATMLSENAANNYKNIDQVLEMLMRSEKTLKKRGEGPQLSIDSALAVLRERMLLELARRRAKATEKQIIANRKILEQLGRRRRRRRRSVDNWEQFTPISPPATTGRHNKQARASKLTIDCEQVNCNLDHLNAHWSNLHDTLRNSMINGPNRASTGFSRIPASRWSGLYSSASLASRNRFRNNDRYAAFDRLVAESEPSQNEINQDQQQQFDEQPQQDRAPMFVSQLANNYKINKVVNRNLSGSVRTNSRKPSHWFSSSSSSPNRSTNDDRNSYRLVSL